LPIDFEQIQLNHSYDRPWLARTWGYESFNAISRGVVSSTGSNVLVFFVTREKQQALTQYEDRIDADLLFWEGERGHGSDNRIVTRRDEIHVFFRNRHHSDFLYKGRAKLSQYRLHSGRPARFVFQLIDQIVSDEELLAESAVPYGPSVTEREALVQSRLGQGQYRQRAIALWGSCSVTGFTKHPVLVASHIKPWRMSTNVERLDPHNSLLLVPTLDKLFDRGYVGFTPEGQILLSDKIAKVDWKRIAVSPDLSLRRVPEASKPFLAYHAEYVFDLVEG